jgi:SAM-dependent methyltransferase
VIRLNLGCNDGHLPAADGWVNVDRCPPADVLWDLSVAPWPWEDNSVDHILSSHIFEHLPNKIQTMNESHRILKPGGTLELIVPTTDGRGAWQDPQHCSFWTPNDLWYYEAGNIHRERFGVHYGITARFRMLSVNHWDARDRIWILTAMLEAAK